MGCRGLSESTLVKIPHCWKLHVTAYLAADNSHEKACFLTSLSLVSAVNNAVLNILFHALGRPGSCPYGGE